MAVDKSEVSALEKSEVLFGAAIFIFSLLQWLENCNWEK